MELLIKECVVCNSKDLKVVKWAMIFQRQTPGDIAIPEQECIECQNCGEHYFDENQASEAAKKIDVHLARME